MISSVASARSTLGKHHNDTDSPANQLAVPRMRNDLRVCMCREKPFTPPFLRDSYKTSLGDDLNGQFSALFYGIREGSEERFQEKVEEISLVVRESIILYCFFPESLQCSSPSGAVLIEQRVDISLQFL